MEGPLAACYLFAMPLIDRPETFVGWRYLFRQRRSRTAMIGTLAFGLLAAASLGAFLGRTWPPGSTAPGVLAVAGILALYCFCTFLFLNFFSVFTTISMTGVFWGVSALTVVLSVTSGFQGEFQAKVLGVNAHILVMKYGLDFAEYRDVINKIEKVPGVKKPVAPFVFNEMMIGHNAIRSGTIVKGVLPAKAAQVLDIKDKMIDGTLDALDHPLPARDGGAALPQILIGKELAKKLHARVGDRVVLMAPSGLDPSLWQAEGKAPKVREYRVGGVFYSGFDEYDRRLVYVSLGEAQALLEGGDVVTGVEMQIDDVYKSREIARDIDRALGGSPYRIIDWRELNHNLFTALRLQKFALAILLFVIILVAMFGVIATMTMLVIDKTREIAIIKSIGMRSSSVAGTFQAAGMTIAALGTGAGVGIGLAVCALLRRYSYQLDPRVYLIDRLPVQVNLDEILIIAGVTLAISFFATLIPSLRAAGLRPVEGLRYE